MSYPPFSNMLMIMITGENLKKTEERAAYLKELIQRESDSSTRILGPTDAGIAKIKDVYRKVIYLRNEDYDILIGIKDKIEAELLRTTAGDGTYVGFDFNPMNGI